MRIAAETDLMVVVGGRQSSNTKKLFELSQGICKNVVLIETAKELETYKFKNISKVGVTACLLYTSRSEVSSSDEDVPFDSAYIEERANFGRNLKA